MSKPELTPELARSLMEQAVESKGRGYIYEQPVISFDDDGNRVIIPAEEYDEGEHVQTCLYVNNGAPSCLVGHVLHMAGVPLGALEEFEDSSASTVTRALTTTTERVVEALLQAQEAQDHGVSWGEALERFQLVLDESEGVA